MLSAGWKVVLIAQSVYIDAMISCWMYICIEHESVVPWIMLKSLGAAGDRLQKYMYK